MKERPILFSGAMVRALLDGSKTQTRRIVKLPHQNPLGQWEPTQIGGPDGGRLSNGATIPLQGGIWYTRTGDSLICPHGQPDDRLYVRETWQYADWTDIGEPHIGYKADSKRTVIEDVPEDWCTRVEAIWRALSEPANYDIDDRAADRKWRPSIHMPRWASRILLEIVSIRVERLNDISEADALAEGAMTWAQEQETQIKDTSDARHAFMNLWQSINGPSSWDANPWVWVIEFKRIQKESP